MLLKILKITAVVAMITFLIACGTSGRKKWTGKYYDPTSAELQHIGSLIFRNETSMQHDKLVFWNPNEEFPSLGIGHFIWYPKGFNGLFSDSFPGLIEFYLFQGIKPPSILIAPKSPWPNREALEAARRRGELDEVIDFLAVTKGVQVQYIAQRLNSVLPKMMAASSRPDHVRQQFERLANSPNGLYPLIDYLNFKGEGLKTIPEYNHVGWGLLQVLEGMSGWRTGKSAFQSFTKSCTHVLTKRVNNQPHNKNEQGFLPGWINRCQSYTSDS